MSDSDNLSSKNKKMLENIEQSLKDKESDSSTETTEQSKSASTSIEDEKVAPQKKSSPDITSTATKSTDTHRKNKPAKAEAVKQKGNGGLWFVTVINFLLVLCIIGAAYWYYTQIAGDESQQQASVDNLSQNVDMIERDVQNNIDRLNKTISELEQQLSKQQNSNQETLSTIESAISTNSATSNALADKLAEMSGRRPSDWLLAEANYLVNMAGRKLYLEKDLQTAVTLLQEADARLVDLNDPSLFPVRALIAADIQALNQVNPTSTTSIALAIGGILPKIPELTLDTLQIPESTVNQDLTLSEDVADWKENLSRTWEAIVGDLISIDHVDQPLEPYLAERQQWLIEQQLMHSLTQAQTAALNEQVTLYQSSMQQAIALIVEHYKLDDTQVSQMLVALQELQNIDFSRNYPSKLESQASLSDIIKRRLQGVFNNRSVDGELFDEGNKL